MTDPSPKWYHRLYVGMQYLLPQHLLSTLMYRLTRLRWRPLKNLVIRGFVRNFRVDMSESLEPDATAYETFNHFFTRELRPGARPLPAVPDAVLCPADGTVSQLGKIANGRVFQAKGRDYSLLELLGGRDDWASAFEGGSFATIYLSPRDYHRVHMPLAGDLREMIHVPGRLFSVNPVTTALVPRLFARNERLACLFAEEAGPLARDHGGGHLRRQHGNGLGGTGHARRTSEARAAAPKARPQSASTAARRWGASTWAPPLSCCYHRNMSRRSRFCSSRQRIGGDRVACEDSDPSLASR